ncbi:MAG: beta-N-acetylhexosaminidase [Gammaproteobacteria bacterium]|nr:beta-N-acetylhexosaminidase [Gammaproteobacteria bacterium]MDH5613592.1 beta-N-acetylhexosaminidase [Gammaproteobacteria bacterium]
MLDLVGLEVTPEEKDMLRHPLTGGVILFTRNYESPEQLAELIQQIHAARKPPVLVSVDHEGGRVQRFHKGFTSLPPVSYLGKVYDNNPQKARELATKTGWLMASELRAVGVDFSFAPILDLDRGISQVIGDRAFHKTVDGVSNIAQAYIKGMEQAGMKATGKHFPGHGAVDVDSHVGVPVDTRAFEDIYMEDVVPFERLINFGLAAVMTAHIIYPAIDNKLASYSEFWLKDVLRQRLGFQGVIFSDDLSMEGATVAGGVVERAKSALKAGCDMVLVCNHPESASAVLDGLGNYSSAASQMRLARMHGRNTIGRNELLASHQWKDTVSEVMEYAEPGTLELDV